jgi:hypothetical protein
MKNTLSQIQKIRLIIEQESLDSTNSFYSTLENISKKGGLKKQEKGSLTYQDEVSVLQKALVLLGFKLPKFGVDGLYADETQSAIDQFNKTNNQQLTSNSISSESINLMISQLKQKNISSKDLDTYVKVNVNDDDLFSYIDINTNEGYEKYANICQDFINNKSPNPLGITGKMLAYSARIALRQSGTYVPPELALAQLLLEGGIGNSNINSRPIKTKNPYNVGNVDSGENKYYNDVQSAITEYFNLIGRRYLSNKKPIDLLSSFVNSNNNRYASDPQYESKLYSIIRNINKTPENLA